VQAVRNPFENEMFTKQAQVEQEAQKLYKKSPDEAREYLTYYSNGLMNHVTEMYIGLRNSIITKYTNNHE
jgi:dipeptidase